MIHAPVTLTYGSTGGRKSLARVPEDGSLPRRLRLIRVVLYQSLEVRHLPFGSRLSQESTGMLRWLDGYGAPASERASRRGAWSRPDCAGGTLLRRPGPLRQPGRRQRRAGGIHARPRGVPGLITREYARLEEEGRAVIEHLSAQDAVSPLKGDRGDHDAGGSRGGGRGPLRLERRAFPPVTDRAPRERGSHAGRGFLANPSWAWPVPFTPGRRRGCCVESPASTPVSTAVLAGTLSVGRRTACPSGVAE